MDCTIPTRSTPRGRRAFLSSFRALPAPAVGVLLWVLSLSACTLGVPLGAQRGVGDEILIPPPSPTIHAHYSAVWQAGAEEKRWLRADDPSALEAPAELTAAGFRLADVEVWVEAGKRRHLGVYRASRGSRTLTAGLGEAEFRGALESNPCLLGFEAWREDGETLYAGVWGGGCRSTRLETGLTRRQFRQKLRQLGATHHLVDLETVLVGGQLEISGLWHAGPQGPLRYALGQPWEPAFHNRVHALGEAADSWRPFDLDIQREGSKTRYSGLWRPGDEQDWLAIDYLEHQFETAHSNLIAGKGSGLGQGDPQDTLAVRFPKLQLVTVEVYTARHDKGTPNEGEPPHDSGTAGPP